LEEPTNRELNESGQPGTADQDFEEFEIAEAELIDAYVHNELSAEERQLVEKGLRRSPRLVERLHFARMLAEASSSAPAFVSPPVEPETVTDRAQAEPVEIPWWKGFFSASLVPQPAFRLALAVCVIFVLLGGVASIVGWMKLRNESNRLGRERAAVEQQRVELEKRLVEQQSSREQLTAELQKERQQREAAEKIIEDLKLQQNPNDQRNPSAISNFASILLFPSGTRGGGAKVLPVSPTTSEIRVDLSLEAAEYPSYRVVIEDSGRRVIAQQRARVRHTRSGPILSIRVPAQRFPQGDYQIHVSGLTSSGALDPVEDYVFRVTEKKE
jgi:hypothetical protein